MIQLTRRQFVTVLGASAVSPLTSGCRGAGSQRARDAAPTLSQIAALSFVDKQDQAGIAFTHTDGGCGRHYFVEQFCSGCGFVDFDGDGHLDVYAVNGAPLPGVMPSNQSRHEMYRNRGDGTFENVTDQVGLGSTRFGGGICAGDYDNDGKIELYVTCYGKNHLYKMGPNGKYIDIAEHAGVAGDACISTSACFFDYDNDGWLDLYVCHYVDYSLDKDRFCGVGKSHKSYCGPEVFASHRDTLYHNNRDGTFTDVSLHSRIVQPRSKSLGVVATDVDNDGWIDLYVTCDLEPNILLINNRDGTFSEKGVVNGVAYGMDGAALAGMGITAGDYDNDGNIDLHVTNYSMEMNSLFRNTGRGSFTYESLSTGIGPPSLVPLGFGTHFADFDNDGWLDVVVANGHVLDDCHDNNTALEYAQPLQLYLNHVGKAFEDVSARSGPAFQSKFVGRGLAVGDYDNDGRLDILVSNNKGPLRLIHNECSNSNNWIKFQLTGTQGNRSAIGARVEIVTATGRQVQEVYSGSSYLSQSDFRPHFGVGSDSKALEVRVRWPGSGGRPGKVEIWKDLEINRIHHLVEGTTLIKGEPKS